MVHVMRKERHQNLTTSLKTLSHYLVYPMRALPLTTRLLSSIKLLPIFVTSDKGCITESSSSHHHTQSQKHHHHHRLHHPKKRTPQHAQVKLRVRNHQGETSGQVMRPILMFIWHISLDKWSRWLPKSACICWSCSMTSTRETSALNEEEGADEEEDWEEGAAGFVGATSEGSTQGCFTVSCAALLRIDFLLMAPMT